ncbi:Succinate-semialdehyde dehydrogenase [NAD]; Succinate-semialdehyde dehydrogenase [NAD(P)+] [Mycetocola reblochoni REB411]|uniref:Succinate-semialdehyde dehydrogenase [NAD] Succinate-semialdehyde dehydrogenase [NAD(P)+] n=1 Tax=Mycetocola reblochoni REB411 TaxID=1255698 RepID=A0A1R4JTL4_9MICO|nr:Succinate-semialdehyde dehydrogenase [NAD]; Succinate-semialdehyde dehydrogenase [NAD(P)+] [Mycetocola reblochoni REB411]
MNPYTNEVVATFPDATDAEVDRALDTAQAAFEEWRDTPLADRAALLGRAAALLREQSEEYARILTLEMGKTIAEARAEVGLSADILQWYADRGEGLLQPRVLEHSPESGKSAKILKQPLGIIYTVEPWNFPYYQVVRVGAPQLMAGNTVVLKHASNVPQSAAAMEKLFHDAGAREGLLTNLYLTRDQSGRVIEDFRVRGVALTGSEGAGAVIASQAGKALKKSTLELGGNDAFIVLEDADIAKSAEWGAFGRYWNAGQVCCSSKRMIVLDGVYDEYLERFTAEVATRRAGDPFDEDTVLAPLSSQGAADDVKALIAEAVEHGATATEVGEPVPSTGAFVQPTILTGVTRDNPVFRKEIFGPVAMVLRAGSEDEAIEIANDTPYGLGGSVFTSDEAHGQELAERITTGMVYINHPTGVKADLPFGGVQNAGYGRELLDLGLNEFVNEKLVVVSDIDGVF